MSGASTSAAGAGAGGGEAYFRPPFTAVQWQELNQQALIYKYLVAGLPVPSDLVVAVRRSVEALSARIFHHPNLGFVSYYGKKYDPEPGRCRRTDGKKWRCSKDAHPDSKYCERHMHRGRNRSRKPVESQSNTQSLSTVMSHSATGSSTVGGSFQSIGGGSFQNLPLYNVANSEALCFGSNVTKLQMEPMSHGINNKEYRYLQGIPDAEEQNFSPEASGSARVLGIETNENSAWRFIPSPVPSSPLVKPRNDLHLQGGSPQLHMLQAFEPMTGAVPKQQQQHCLFGSEIGSPGPVKQEEQSMRSFFDEWPKTREWPNFDDERSNKNTFSRTQLSISMTPSEYPSRSACSPDSADG